ncbi:MAG: LytTR family DNA-binding domain-containing protein [Lachnospiraceae bacterium]
MLSIAVCDDEIQECCRIADRIREVLEEMKISCTIRQYNSGRELLRAQEDFDIIFLDIIMRDLDGIQTAQLVRGKAYDRILIFLSSSRDYVFDAYDVEAFQYLLKPLDGHKLRKVLEAAVRKTQKQSREFILVSKGRQTRKLFLDDISYFEIRGRVIEVHGREGIFTYYEQIGILEKNLQGKGFFRCHKSYLINLKHVDSYNRQEVILDQGERVAVAKRRYDQFCMEILEYMRKR